MRMDERNIVKRVLMTYIRGKRNKERPKDRRKDACKTKGNHPVNWPKLLGPFQNVSITFSMCMCSECHSTSLTVQRSHIFVF